MEEEGFFFSSLFSLSAGVSRNWMIVIDGYYYSDGEAKLISTDETGTFQTPQEMGIILVQCKIKNWRDS